MEFPPAQRAAFAFARELSYEPHRLTDADITHLRSHYTELQILEMILSVAGNNALNRWKEGVGVPQSKDLSGFAKRAEKPPAANRLLPTHSFLTPTAEKYQHRVSKVAPLLVDAPTEEASQPAVYRRPPLETRAEVEKRWRTTGSGHRVSRS